jgi:hypothetical protein
MEYGLLEAVLHCISTVDLSSVPLCPWNICISMSHSLLNYYNDMLHGISRLLDYLIDLQKFKISLSVFSMHHMP